MTKKSDQFLIVIFQYLKIRARGMNPGSSKPFCQPGFKQLLFTVMKIDPALMIDQITELFILTGSYLHAVVILQFIEKRQNMEPALSILNRPVWL